MHRHRFEFSSNWPNDMVCKHTCRTSQESCTAFADDIVHGVRGTRLVPAGFYVTSDLTDKIPTRLHNNPARVLPEPEPSTAGVRHDGTENLALTPEQVNDFELRFRLEWSAGPEEDPEVELDLACTGGDQVLVVKTFSPMVKLSTVLDFARTHWLRYHSSLRH